VTSATKLALVVRGGWFGHQPIEATDLFIPHLESHGYRVRVEDSPKSYADAGYMAGVDLVLQCMTLSTIATDELAGLRTAVAAGTGLAGWHGGIADSYRDSSDYLQLIGGQFACHPGKALVTEQYWVLADTYIDVLATTTQAVRPWDEWHRPVTSPAVWTRQWGAGRVFVCTPGHRVEVLQDPNVRTIVERGLLWASR
jgi:type 1 glutamine amidotransferase